MLLITQKKYDHKPPMFSRATLPPNTGLFISGTASIVKENTIHIGNPAKQTKETLKNIQALISKVNLKKYGINKGYKINDITDWKIYIKNIYDKDVIESEFLKVVSKTPNYIIVTSC